ncbi:MAG: DUF1674 domain-containing protein [Gammaproteobacteria bacterium]|nr:MAG: DUF1674 domain-containing protein [Gammaproteobacteria bacterium]TLZ00207.1 MAG: DUF1674 domain-containing protein [Gammaproteobacteria bacterium]TLZ09712.1 MAG: DUF1674 domain-containing protein [Gammaproteobacteria bacterium]TLZ10645.1 MAG: DUF1674 domain-containing protein [Gammaproteobacteria bacterium]
MGMPTPHRKNPEESFSTPPADPADPRPHAPSPHEPRPHELGGRAGPEPTRFGDWEKNGRCIDF